MILCIFDSYLFRGAFVAEIFAPRPRPRQNFRREGLGGAVFFHKNRQRVTGTVHSLTSGACVCQIWSFMSAVIVCQRKLSCQDGILGGESPHFYPICVESRVPGVFQWSSAKKKFDDRASKATISANVCVSAILRTEVEIFTDKWFCVSREGGCVASSPWDACALRLPQTRGVWFELMTLAPSSGIHPYLCETGSNALSLP